MGTENTTSPTNRSPGLDEIYRRIQTANVVIYCLIVIFGTLGNGLVIYVTGFKMKRSVNSVWFLNLALADFLFTTFLIFSTVSLSRGHQWPFGQPMCKFSNFLSLVNMFASVFFLTAISLDRCVSIWVVAWAQNKRSVRKAQIMCVVVWVTAAICSIPNATFRSVKEIRGVFKCVYGREMTPEQKWILYTFRFVMGFLIPFLVILVSYVAIGIRARRLHNTRKRRPCRIILSIIFAFFICWLPFHVVSFMELKAKTNPSLRSVVKIGGPVTLTLAFMNSALNPILYVFMCEEFQKKLKRSICFVLESALAEDPTSFKSSRSFSTQLSRIVHKSESAPLEDRKLSTDLN
ncbi:chemokine-like receptor 1 [Salarias fasciatus]|uniref:chemokine-like receptor 1 n=1 Tax=Salarias fasciatus TaxID=181472 RepID=UPI0011764B20|nr:chemokine-like receptor 1 [Salarias fasciatus]